MRAVSCAQKFLAASASAATLNDALCALSPSTSSGPRLSKGALRQAQRACTCMHVGCASFVTARRPQSSGGARGGRPPRNHQGPNSEFSNPRSGLFGASLRFACRSPRRIAGCMHC